MSIRGIISNEIELIAPYDELEKQHIANTLEWIASGAAIFRIKKPDVPSQHLVSYFVLVDTARRALLLGDHVTSLLQLPSGGHVEPNEHPVDTVERECQEELGKVARFLYDRHPFFVTVTNTNPLSGVGQHTDVSLWYLLEGDTFEHIDFDRREFHDVTWWTFDEIMETPSDIFDPHLHRFTQKLIRYLER